MATLCSSFNPLAQFTKHAHEDREAQKDRLVSRNPALDRGNFRSTVTGNNGQMALEFAEFTNRHLDFPIQEAILQQIPLGHDEVPLPYGSSVGADWGLEFQNSSFVQVKSPLAQDTTSRSSVGTPRPNSASHNRGNPAFRNGPVNQIGKGIMPFGNATLGFNWHPQPVSKLSQPQAQDAIERLDWESVFASLDPEQAVESRLPPTSREERDYMFTDRQSCSHLTGFSDSKTIPAAQPSFREQNLTYKPANIVENTPNINKQEERHNSVAAHDDTDFIPMDSNAQTHQNSTDPSLLVASATEYRFQDTNPFLASSNPFYEGLEIVSNDGNLSLAVLAFEAACQQDPDHFDAWRMLGSVQSENEQESAAIIALKEALRLDPTSLDVIMKLAVSYTNEGTIRLAHEYLAQWLRSKYPQIPIEEFAPTNYFPTFSESLERLKEAYIKAAQLSITTNEVDPDVQVGLGTLLFSAQDYELAADCFSSAIQTSVPGTTNTQSQLHLLWNRYGACLGNLKQHESGIEAYEMALAIRPNFVRARYNLALLYYSRNEPLLAAQNTLQALKAYAAAESGAQKEMLKIVMVGTSHGQLQEIGKRDNPTSLYETLRSCCGNLCRWDLMQAVGPGMDLRAFQSELDRI